MRGWIRLTPDQYAFLMAFHNDKWNRNMMKQFGFVMLYGTAPDALFPIWSLPDIKREDYCAN